MLPLGQGPLSHLQLLNVLCRPDANTLLGKCLNSLLGDGSDSHKIDRRRIDVFVKYKLISSTCPDDDQIMFGLDDARNVSNTCLTHDQAMHEP